MKKLLLPLLAIALCAGCTTATYSNLNPKTGQVTNIKITRPPFINSRYAKIVITPDGKLSVNGAEATNDVEAQATMWNGLGNFGAQIAEGAARGARPVP